MLNGWWELYKMKDRGLKDALLSKHVLLLGIGAAALIWSVDILVDVFVFREGTVRQQIFSPESFEIYFRGVVWSIVVIFGVYAQSVVTKLKTAEEALSKSAGEIKEAKEYTDLVVNSMSNGMVTIDRDYKIVSANRAFFKTSGRSLDEVIGKHCYEISHDTNEPCNTPQHTCPFKEVLETDEPSTAVHTHIDKDGNEIYVELIASPVKDEEGNVVQMLELTRDITERRKAERKLKRYTEELEESNRLKDLFTDIMTHDLLGPAGAIRNATELMRDEAKGTGKPLLDIIEWGATKQIGMIESASKLSKLKSVEDLEKKSLDLKEVIDRAVEDTRHLFEAAGMWVENKATKSMPVKANPVIEDIFFNLLSNAAKYAAAGEKAVIEALDKEEVYTVMVKDYGLGIPDKNKVGIFERFARKEKAGVKGTGLGLAITKRIVELHDGKVWLEDNLEGGSTFCVNLPK
jgi:PAS domain S-box-containing protein